MNVQKSSGRGKGKKIYVSLNKTVWLSLIHLMSTNNQRVKKQGSTNSKTGSKVMQSRLLWD